MMEKISLWKSQSFLLNVDLKDSDIQRAHRLDKKELEILDG